MDDLEEDLTNHNPQTVQQPTKFYQSQAAGPLQKLKKQKRCLPWNTDVLKDRFTPQVYQIELLKLALNKNLLVFIRSDEYKNYLLIMLMKEYEQLIQNYTNQNHNKKIFILVNYQLSITKYYDLLKQHTNLKLQNLNQLNLIQLLQNSNEILVNNSIFIINIQLFNEWLNRSLININDILLIIFDDVHNIFYNLNNKLIYENIMNKLSSVSSTLPHLVGFGTLILNTHIKSIKYLDKNLDYLKNLFKCSIEFASDLLNTQNLLNGIKNQELIELCETIKHDEFSKNLLNLLNETLSYLNDLNLSEYKRLNQLSNDIDCIYIICLKCINECIYMLNTIGIWCLTKSLLPILCQLDKLTHYLISTQTQQFEFILLLQYITSKLRLVRELCIRQIILAKHKSANRHEFNDLLISKFCTPKIKCLIQILRSYKTQQQQQFCCLIYVKNKQVAITLSLLLKKLSKEDVRLNYLSPNYVINNQTITDENISSLDDANLTGNSGVAFNASSTTAATTTTNNNDFLKQEEILRKFHSGDINLLICTFDMEEYIDVPQVCNLIIRFDCDYFNYYSYILSKTRLKSIKADNKIIYICEQYQFNEFLKKYKKIKQLEYLFESKYSILLKRLSLFNQQQQHQQQKFENDEDLVYYPNESNKSLSINLNNSIELLNRYCIRLPSDALTQLTPNFKINLNSLNQFKCKLILPINSCLRGYEFESSWHSTISDSFKYIAYLICRRLIELNELNSNLESITKEYFYKQQLNTLFSDKFLLNEDLDELNEEIKSVDLSQQNVPFKKYNRYNKYNNKNYQQQHQAPQQYQHRVGSSKRKQIYKKKISNYLTQSTFDTQHQNYLYRFKCELTTPLTTMPLPTKRTQTEKFFAIITQKRLLEVPDYTIFTQFGEETISVELIKENFYLTLNQIKLIKNFHKFLFSYVLRMERTPVSYQSESTGAFICLVTQTSGYKFDIDWQLMRLVENYNDKSFIKPIGENNTENVVHEDDEKFVFNEEKFTDAVVIPYYRYSDFQPQFYCVQSIDYSLNPLAKFPSNNVLYQTFYDYYSIKYNKIIYNFEQPMLVVQHPSTRLNLLTPRYMNLKASVLQKSVYHHHSNKGHDMTTSSDAVSAAAATQGATSTTKSNKIYLVPELVNIHPFSCTLWKRCLSLPSILYRLNSLLICEELRRDVAQSTNVGVPWIENNFKFEKLEFNWDFKREIEISHIPDLEVDINSKTQNYGANDFNQVDDNWNFEISEWNSSCITTQIKESTMNKNGWFENFDQNKTLFLDTNDLAMFEDEYYGDEDDDMLSQGNSWKYDNEVDDEEDNDDDEDGNSRHINNKNSSSNQDASNKADKKQTDKNDNSNNSSNESVNNKFTINFNNLKADLKRKSAKLLSKLNVSNKELKTFLVNSNSNSNSQSMYDNGDHAGDHDNIDNTDDMNDDLIKFFNETQLMYLKMSNEAKVTAQNSNGEEFISNNNVENDFDEDQDEFDYGNWLSNVEIKFNRSETMDLLDKLTNLRARLTSKCLNSTQIFDLNELFNYEENFMNRLNEYFKINDKSSNVEKIADTYGIINPAAINLKFNFNLDYDHDNCMNNENNGSDDDDDDDYDSQEKNPGPGPALLLQALTLSNASDGFNLERLETIGDSFLKQAITVYLFSIYLNINEGKLSYLRSKQVSNLNLYKLGKRRGIHEIIHANKFEPFDSWLPLHYDVSYASSLTFDQLFAAAFQKMASKNTAPASTQPQQSTTTTTTSTTASSPAPPAPAATKPSAVVINPNKFDKYKMHIVSDKSIADSVEAIIGAYLIKSGPKAALRVMYWFGLQVLPKVKLEDGSEVHIDLAIPCKPEITNYNKLNYLLEGYENFESIIGYRFKTRAYLLQAFTHASYVYNDVTDCYQRLEFLGDAILDYVITRHLYEDPKKHSPGELTDLRSALVNNNIFSYLAVKYEFYKYFKYLSPQLFLIIDNFIKNYKKFNDDDLDENFLFNYSSDADEDDDDLEFADCIDDTSTSKNISNATGVNDELFNNEFEELEVPKVLGDIFESVAGAIFLDSNKSLDTVWKVYFTLMKPYIEKYTTKVPKSPIRELLELEPETAKFEKPERTIDGKIRVTVNVFGKGKFKGIGRNYRIAKNAAAKLGLKYIRKQE